MNAPCLLLVEDDENDVFLMRYASKQAGTEVILRVVHNGQQAVDYLSGSGPYADREHFPLPCLVLLDLKVSLLNGLDVLKWIRAQPSTQTMVVIVFSSSAHPDDIARAYRLGANSFVVKPADTTARREFVEALRSWWLTFNQFP